MPVWAPTEVGDQMTLARLGPIERFERAYWSDYIELRSELAALRREDPGAFEQAAHEAYEVLDSKTMTAVADALAATGEINHWAAHWASVALLAFGFGELAADVLAQVPAGPKNVKFHVSRALALVACGQIPAARDYLASELPEGEIDKSLDALRESLDLACADEEAFTSGPDWNRAWRLTAFFLSWGARRQSRRVVECALGLPPAVEKPEYSDMFRVLTLGLKLGVDIEAIEKVLAVARSKRPAKTDLKALALTCELERGRPFAPTADPLLTENSGLRFAHALAKQAWGDLEDATASLGRLCNEFRTDGEVRYALADCVGALVLRDAKPSFARTRRRPRPRIVNVLPFYNELSLLKLHLDEMAGWVDHFVIVEADQTFAGVPKPLVFHENQHLFSAYASQITHIAVRFPESLNTHWARDFYQRDSAVAPLPDLCGEDDHVLITDVDEIVAGRALEGFTGDFAGLRMKTYRFFLNYGPIQQTPRRTGAIFKAKYLDRFGISHARFAISRHHPDWPRILDAGWHFTSVGEAETIAAKYRNYAHQERSNPLHSEDRAVELLAAVRAGRYEDGWTKHDIDESFPAFIVKNLTEMADVIL